MAEKAQPSLSLATRSELAQSLAKFTISGDRPSQTSQIRHRLDLLVKWFGSLEEAKLALRGRTVLEIGCGQGDMTVPLAYLVDSDRSGDGSVFAVDPAPLDYGAPYTLGDSQETISKSQIGGVVRWIQNDPMQNIPELVKGEAWPDYVVMAHSIWYLPSEEYFFELLRSSSNMAKTKKSDSPVKVLLAEWGMQQSDEKSKAHILAVELQEEKAWDSGNVQTVMRPEKILQLAKDAGWKLENEKWIEQPDVEDGKWEVNNVKHSLDSKGLSESGKMKFQAMLSLNKDPERIGSMDVWTGVFVLSE